MRTHRQHKLAADTRSWAIAEEKRAELQRRLDAGETGTVLPPSPEVKRPTIAQQIETFLTAKQSEGRSPATMRKLKYQLNTLEQFLAGRSKFFASEITGPDLVEFRSGWSKTWQAGRTRRLAQTNLRGFLRGKVPLDVLNVWKPIKLSEADEARTEPKPFSEAELARLLAQVPKTFPRATTAAKLTTLIHFMAATGTAIRDTVQLERAHIEDGWLRFKRQKTRKRVNQRLDDGLYRELLAVANSNPRYVFWNGTSLPTSSTGLWQENLRRVMEDAGLWIKGNLSHRFRDTAADFWLGAGWSLTEIAAALGDTVAVVEKHYADLASRRMADRLAALPRRSWSATV